MAEHTHIQVSTSYSLDTTTWPPSWQNTRTYRLVLPTHLILQHSHQVGRTHAHTGWYFLLTWYYNTATKLAEHTYIQIGTSYSLDTTTQPSSKLAEHMHIQVSTSYSLDTTTQPPSWQNTRTYRLVLPTHLILQHSHQVSWQNTRTYRLVLPTHLILQHSHQVGRTHVHTDWYFLLTWYYNIATKLAEHTHIQVSTSYSLDTTTQPPSWQNTRTYRLVLPTHLILQHSHQVGRTHAHTGWYFLLTWYYNTAIKLAEHTHIQVGTSYSLDTTTQPPSWQNTHIQVSTSYSLDTTTQPPSWQNTHIQVGTSYSLDTTTRPSSWQNTRTYRLVLPTHLILQHGHQVGRTHAHTD